MNPRSAIFIPVFVLATAAAASAQNTTSKDVTVINTPGVTVLNSPTVGIDPARNAVTVVQTRQPFQARANLDIPQGANADGATIAIPAGKRLVIEDVSAVTFQTPGEGLLITFTTAVDDVVGANQNGGFEGHDLVLVRQMSVNGFDRSTAHQRMLVFADETVTTSSGASHGLGITVSMARGTLNGVSGARVTFSGYLEDLPPAASIK